MKAYKIFLITIWLSLLFTSALLAKNSNSAVEVLFDFGTTLLKEHRYAEAGQEFEKCLILSPEHAQARNLLELCEITVAYEKEEAIALALADMERKIPANNLRIRDGTSPSLSQPDESLAPGIQKGAWTLKKGQTYVETYTKYYWHNHQFNNGRERKRWDYNGKYNEIMTQLKLEYGLSDKDTLLLYTTAKEAGWKDSFKSSSRKGFTEIDPGIKHLLFADPFICSLQLKMKFPLHYSEQATPALGTHQIDGEMKILTAQPWPKLPGYTKFEMGYRLRAEEPNNEIPYFFEFGCKLSPDLILKTTLDGQTAVGGGRAEDWIKYTLGPIFKLGKLFNIEFGFGHTFAGRNTSAAKEVFTSLSSQW